MRVALRWIGTAALLALALVAVACSEEEGSDEPFRIGVMESVTGPGETYGNVAVQAKQMAVDEINEAGGVNGRMIELIVEDEKCNAQDSITAYQKLTDVDEVKIILGDVVFGRDAGGGSAGGGGRGGDVLRLGDEPGHSERGGLYLPNVHERRSGGG